MTWRVTLLSPQVARDGGVAGHVLDSAAALRTAGHHVTLVCARSEYAIADVPSVIYADVSDAPALESTLRSCDADIVHLHDYADPEVVATVRRVAPAVLSAHAYPGCSPNTHYFAPGNECDRPHGLGCFANMALRGCLHARDPRPAPQMFRQASRRMAAYAQADGVIGYSTAVVRHLAQNGFQPRLVPLFTPLEAFDLGQPTHTGTDRCVLFVGRVVPEKGVDILLRALEQVDATLTVIGDGIALPAARILAAELAMSERVRFAGWATGNGLTDAYRNAAVVVVPSLWPEPFGLVGLEAMAFSRPVVASMTGGIVDWLQPHKTGLGVEPGHPDQLRAALTAVLDDPALGRTMGSAGRSALDARFTASAHVAALEDVYTDARTSWSESER